MKKHLMLAVLAVLFTGAAAQADIPPFDPSEPHQRVKNPEARENNEPKEEPKKEPKKEEKKAENKEKKSKSK